MNSNPNLTLNDGSELIDLPRQKGLMELLAKNIRQAVLPLALLMGGCATVQSAQGTQENESAEIEELAPAANGRPSGFEKTETISTKDGDIFNLGTKFRVGGNPGFIVNFKMEKNLIGDDSPGRISPLQEAKATYGYEFVDLGAFMKLEDETKKEVTKWANFLDILKKTKKTLDGMVNFMKKNKPDGYAQFGYGDNFEALESQITRAKSELNKWGVSVMAKPTENQAKKTAEKMLGQEFECYPTGSMTPEQAAVAQFAKATGLSVAEVEAGFVTKIVKTQNEEPRETTAKMTRKTAAEEYVGKEFECYPTGSMTPEQAAVAQFAKATGLSIAEVEAGFVTKIVKTQNEEPRETTAKMTRKTANAGVAPATNMNSPLSGNQSGVGTVATIDMPGIKSKVQAEFDKKRGEDEKKALNDLYGSTPSGNHLPNVAPLDSEGLPTRGDFTSEQIGRYLELRQKTFSSCFPKNEGLKGDITFKFTFGKNGKITQVKTKINTLKDSSAYKQDERFIKCAIKAIERLNLPPQNREITREMNFTL